MNIDTMNIDNERIEAAIRANDGNLTNAAAELSVSRSWLREQGWNKAKVRSFLGGEAPASKAIDSRAVSLGRTMIVKCADFERYATVVAIDDQEVHVQHRGNASSFSRSTGECLESQAGTMRGWTIAPCARGAA